MIVALLAGLPASGAELQMKLTDSGCLNARGFSVMLYQNVYHPVFVDEKNAAMQMILHGQRVATNGDVRLVPTPELWDLVAKLSGVKVDREHNGLTAQLSSTRGRPTPPIRSFASLSLQAPYCRPGSRVRSEWFSLMDASDPMNLRQGGVDDAPRGCGREHLHCRIHQRFFHSFRATDELLQGLQARLNPGKEETNDRGELRSDHSEQRQGPERKDAYEENSGLSLPGCVADNRLRIESRSISAKTLTVATPNIMKMAVINQPMI